MRRCVFHRLFPRRCGKPSWRWDKRGVDIEVRVWAAHNRPLPPRQEFAMSASRFVWYELMTSDVRAAAAFYSAVVGWKADASDPQYTLLKVGDAQVAGMMETPPEVKAMGVPPMWSGYVLVGDVDATEARILQLGGKVIRPGSDIPDVGRFAVVADPQGATFLL